MLISISNFLSRHSSLSPKSPHNELILWDWLWPVDNWVYFLPFIFPCLSHKAFYNAAWKESWSKPEYLGHACRVAQKAHFQVISSHSCFHKRGEIIWLLQVYSLRITVRKECESFGNEHAAHPCHTLEAINIFIARTTDDQFLSTSLFFLNSHIIRLMLKMASALYVISILAWHHQLPLMTLRAVSFLSPPSLQLQDPDVRFRNAFSLARISGVSPQSLSWWLLWKCQQNSTRSH